MSPKVTTKPTTTFIYLPPYWSPFLVKAELKM